MRGELGKMEFIDLKAQYAALKDEIDAGIDKVLNSTHFILGEEEQEFEKKLAEYVGVKHVIGCSDGTAALQLIYMAYGIGKGDAVFCPDMTFVASVEPAFLLGAEPIFCDIDARTYNISIESLERQINAVIHEGKLVPKAIVAVDFIGNPADYDEIKGIARKYHMLLIEDAAQGMGAAANGIKCGALGDVAATSFFPSKPLGCYGDGGAVFTNDDEIDKIIRSIRVHGKGKSKYDNQRVGINARLDTIQAAIMLPKLRVLDDEIRIRQQIAERYNEAFRDKFQIPYIKEGMVSSYAQYALLAKDREQRDHIMERLKANGVPAIIYYPTPLHQMKVFEGCFIGEETFENTISYAEKTFSLPFSAYLGLADQEKIINLLYDISVY